MKPPQALFVQINKKFTRQIKKWKNINTFSNHFCGR